MQFFKNTVISSKNLLDPPVLVSQLDFKMKNLFTVADEPEMTRFNNTCMYRTNAHLMKFFAFNFIERDNYPLLPSYQPGYGDI